MDPIFLAIPKEGWWKFNKYTLWCYVDYETLLRFTVKFIFFVLHSHIYIIL